MVLNHIFLEPVKDKDPINFETDQLDVDKLEDLGHLRVLEAQYFSAEPNLVLKAQNDCLSKDEWQHLLHMLGEKLAFCSSRIDHMRLKLLTPVLN